jgi:2-polyprenyl-6-methoxyphenol hydroxylase-like FAD-dependent oxidoreductase
MTPRTALIVGAGIGGLAAGIALGRAGWRVRIFERAASPGALGFALNLAPNAMMALRELGLAERLIAEGSVVTDVELRRGDGRVLKRLNLAAGQDRAPSVVALRQALHGALLEALQPETLTLGSEAVGFEITTHGVVLTLRDGRAEAGDVLIGADGIRSMVRARLHPDEPPPRRSGYYGLRGVAGDASGGLGDLSGVGYFGHGMEAATVRAGRRAVYWYVSLLAEDVPAPPPSPQVLAERCAAALDDGFRAIVRATRPEDLRLDELTDRAPISDWGNGPVTLLGDAAHPMLPHTGQGAAQALEDAVALGLVLGSTDDPVASLRRYERVRSARTRSIVHRGLRIARFTASKSPMLSWLRATAIRIAPATAMAAAFMLAGRSDPHRSLRSPASSRPPTARSSREASP